MKLILGGAAIVLIIGASEFIWVLHTAERRRPMRPKGSKKNTSTSPIQRANRRSNTGGTDHTIPTGRLNQRRHTGAGERSRRTRSDMAGGSTSTFTGGIPMKTSGETENVSSGAKAMRYRARCRCAFATIPEGTFHPTERCRPDRSCGLN